MFSTFSRGKVTSFNLSDLAKPKTKDDFYTSLLTKSTFRYVRVRLVFATHIKYCFHIPCLAKGNAPITLINL
jgi:hypothetical protein